MDALHSLNFGETASIDHPEYGKITLIPSVDFHGGAPSFVQPSESDECLHVRTKQWLIPMLNHNSRNESYAEAIASLASAPERSLDIGTGTGLLAYLTKSLYPECKVTSLEMSDAMQSIASKVLTSHSIEMKLQHSTSYTGPVPDLCTSELLDYQLLGEGVLPALRDLRDRNVINDATKVIPSRAIIYAQLISDPLGYDHPTEAGGISLGSYFDCTPAVVPIQSKKLSIGKLSESFACLPISFSPPSSLPQPHGSSHTSTVLASSSGVVKAVLFSFVLFTSETSPPISTSEEAEFQDHWPQSLYILPPSCHLSVALGDEIEVESCHDDSTIWFSVLKSVAKKRKISLDRPPLTPLSAVRNLQLNNSARNAFFRSEVKAAVREGNAVLDVSDFCLLALMASSLGAYVTSLEAPNSECAFYAAIVAQRYNNKVDREKFEILSAYPEHVTSDALKAPVDVVVSECYCSRAESNAFIGALQTLRALIGLRAHGVLSSSVRYVPTSSVVTARAAYFPELALAYKKVGIIHGLDHKVLDDLNEYTSYDLGFNVDQYEVHWCGHAVEVATINYATGSDGDDSSTKIEIPAGSKASALVMDLKHNGGKTNQVMACDTSRVIFLGRTITGPKTIDLSWKTDVNYSFSVHIVK